MALQLHLFKNALGNVVVAAPIGGLLGIGELVHVMAIHFIGQVLRRRVHLAGMGDKMAMAAQRFD